MEGVSTYLITQGVLGISVLVLGYVVGKLYSKTERLEKEKSDLAEARRLDDREQFEKLTQLVHDFTQSNRILTEKIEVSKVVHRDNR